MSILTTAQKTFVDLTDRSIVSVTTEYAKSESSSSAPASGWSTTAPLWEDGKYIWSRVKTTYNITDPDTGLDYTISNPVCATGSKGATGVGVASAIKWYYASTSESSITGGTWVIIAPAYDSSKYLWTKEITTFDDGTTSETTPVLDQEWKTLVEFKGTLDGKIESWFYSGRPSSAVLPESQWGSADVKRTHVGDNYYDTDSGYAYTYKEDTYQETDVTSPIYTFNLPSDVQNKAELKSISGRTIVWNQLVRNGNFANTSEWVALGNFSVSSNIATYTPSNVYNTLRQRNDNLIYGHKYFMSAEVKLTTAYAYYRICLGDPGYAGAQGVVIVLSIGNTNWNTVSTIGTFNYVNGASEKSFMIQEMRTDNHDAIQLANCQLFDLTLMFGAGNEPSTVAEFKAMFPNVFYAYDAGSLLSGKCDKVVSVEKNLYDVTKTDTNSFNIINGKLSNKAVDTNRNYFRLSIQNVDNHYALIKAVDYSTTGNKSTNFTITEKCKLRVVHNGNTRNLNITQGTGVLFEAGTYTVSFNLEGYDPTTVGGLVISNFMIERGSTATTYEPYVEHEYTIPSAIQQLPGYGWSAGNAYNEVDFVNKKYIQRVGSVNLGSLTWVYRTTGSALCPYFYANFLGIKRIGSYQTTRHNVITSRYTTVARNDLVSGTICVDGSDAVASQIQIKDSSFTDAAAFKASLSDAILYYELATPIETDISAYLPVDNSIEVESGGTITLHQSNDTRIKLSNSITYLSKLPSGTCFRWERITDSAVALAMKNASTAQITADNKMQVFVSQPTPPYDVGDLWTKGTDGDGEIMRCSIARASGDFDANDWVKAGTSTDKLRNDLGDESAQVLIDGNHIKAGTIDAGVVTVINLDADNITTGEMSATRVRTGTLESTGYSIAAGATFSTTGTQISLDNGYITTPYFAVNSSGAFINGSITATSGSIGGWNIKSEYLESKIQKSGVYYGIGLWPVASGDSSKNAFAIGDMSNSDWDSCAFRVTGDGVLHATGAQISGNITATSGTIGGWSIHSDYLGTTVGNYGIGLYPAASGGAGNAFAIGYMPDGISGGWGKCAFRVDGKGNIYATSATRTSCTVNGATLDASSVSSFSSTTSIGVVTMGQVPSSQLGNYTYIVENVSTKTGAPKYFYLTTSTQNKVMLYSL